MEQDLDERLLQNRKQERLFDTVPGKLCAVCNGFTLKGRPLCGKCQREFGDSPDWPKWVKFLVADRKKRIYHITHALEEVPLEEAEDIPGDNLR